MINFLLCTNSDIGRGNTIGSRFTKVAIELESRGVDFNIIARANYSKLKVRSPFYKNYLGRFLNALHIYVFPKLNVRLVDLKLFDFFVLRELKKNNLSNCRAALCGEFIFNSIKYLKENGVKVYLDIPIGHDSYYKELEKMDVILGDSDQRTINYINKVIELTDVLIVPSDFVKNTLIMAGFNNKKIEIINFGVTSVKGFTKQNIVSRIVNKPLIFLFAGNVNYRKGVQYLLDAWKIADLPGAKLIICGRIYKEIKNEINKYNFNNVFFTGFVDVKKYFKDAHIFVFPSLWEGSAKAVLEAMSFGLPVITTFNAGSVIEDQKDGFIIPIADSNLLAEKIKFFSQNPEEVVRMGENALDKSLQYPWELYGQKVVRELID